MGGVSTQRTRELHTALAGSTAFRNFLRDSGKSVRWETLASLKCIPCTTCGVRENRTDTASFDNGQTSREWRTAGRPSRRIRNTQLTLYVSILRRLNSSTRYFEILFLLPLLDFNSVISKPQNSNLFTILPRNHLSVVNRKGNAGHQMKARVHWLLASLVSQISWAAEIRPGHFSEWGRLNWTPRPLLSSGWLKAGTRRRFCARDTGLPTTCRFTRTWVAFREDYLPDALEKCKSARVNMQRAPIAGTRSFAARSRSEKQIRPCACFGMGEKYTLFQRENTDLWTVSQTQRGKNHTLLGGTSPCSPYMGVIPGRSTSLSAHSTLDAFFTCPCYSLGRSTTWVVTRSSWSSTAWILLTNWHRAQKSSGETRARLVDEKDVCITP